MSKPLSDKWVETAPYSTTEFYGPLGKMTAASRVARKLARELQRTRAAIREHKEILQASDESNEDRMLYRATLPEGDK